MGDLVAPLGSRAGMTGQHTDFLIEQARGEVASWLAAHPASFVSFSGGKDSLAVLALAREVNPDIPAVFYDSGCEFPQTLTYLAGLAERGVNVRVYPSDPPVLDLLEQSGHWHPGREKTRVPDLGVACVDRPLAAAMADLGAWNLFGLRAEESKGRARHLVPRRGVVERTTGVCAGLTSFAAVWNWTTRDVHAWLGRQPLPINPLYDAMTRLGVPQQRQRVGMMVDGNGLTSGRWTYARALAPSRARQIETLLPLLAQFR